MPKDYQTAQRTMELIKVHEEAAQALGAKGSDHYGPAIETLTKESDRLKGSFESAKAAAPKAAVTPPRKR